MRSPSSYRRLLLLHLDLIRFASWILRPMTLSELRAVCLRRALLSGGNEHRSSVEAGAIVKTTRP